MSNTSMRGFLAAAIGVAVLLTPAVTFGWGSGTHRDLATLIVNAPTIAPFLTTFGLSPSSLVSIAAGEPSPADPMQWHGWPNALNSGRNHNGYLLDSNFVGLTETNLVGDMLHNCCDCGVPINHAPANDVYTDQSLFNPEWYLEGLAVQPSPSSMPTLYTGTYAQKITQFYADQVGTVAQPGLARRFMANHSSSDYGWAAAEGYRNCLRLGQAVLLDHFQLKMPEVAHANGSYTVLPGHTLNLSSSGSYDPDGDAFSSIAWDLDNNGTYDVSGASASISYANLVNVYHLQWGTPYTMKLKVVDDNTADAGVYNEGFDTTTLTLSAPLGGDANLDGWVNVSDLAVLAAHYRKSYSGWANADFNGSGTVDVSDLAILAAHYRQTSGGPSLDQAEAMFGLPQTVPEPSTVVMLGSLMAAAILWWKSWR